MKSALRAALVMSASLLAIEGHAAGFINTSQSTVANGMAYAGFTAGGGRSLSAMFLNPAIITQFPGFTSENNLFAIIPDTVITGRGTVGGPGGPLVPNGTVPSGDIGQDAISGGSYYAYQLNDKIFLGLSINAPFGLTTKPENANFGGRFNSVTTSLRTYNFTPTVAYKVSETFSIGVGLQIQYATARLYSQVSPLVPGGGRAGIEGEGLGFGWTLGATWQPFEGTHIGVGWRSFIDQEISGTSAFLGTRSLNSNGTLQLPNRVNVGLRQEVNKQLDVLLGFEWQNWARIGNARINNAAPNLGTLPFDYQDSYFFSLGTEYKLNSELTLRTGIAYETSALDDRTRTTRLPDNDRIWVSIGASYDVLDRFTINASYSHVFVQKATIAINPGHPAFTAIAYNGSSDAFVDIFSIGLTSRWGAPPKKEAPLVRKF